MNRFRLRRIEAILSRLTTPQQESAAVAPRPLRSAHDVIALLHEQIEALRASRWIGTLEKARPSVIWPASAARRSKRARWRLVSKSWKRCSNNGTKETGDEHGPSGPVVWHAHALGGAAFALAASARADAVEQDRLARSAPKHGFRLRIIGG